MAETRRSINLRNKVSTVRTGRRDSAGIDIAGHWSLVDFSDCCLARSRSMWVLAPRQIDGLGYHPDRCSLH